MKSKKAVKESFSVIGKEGSTSDGEGFVQRLWNEANSNFGLIQHLAKRDADGNIVGIWGAMSDMSRSFMPWEDNFTKGLYLAGVECIETAQAPEGWSKWTVPGFEYLSVECESPDTFPEMIKYMKDNKIPLAGAVQDFTSAKTGKNHMYFPIRKL